MTRFASFFLLGFGLLLAACTYDSTDDLLPPPACNPAAGTYAVVVAPLIQQRCLTCHSNSARGGDISLETHAQVQVVALNGRLLGSVSHAPGFKAMPQGAPKISECEVEQIRFWIAAGAPRN